MRLLTILLYSMLHVRRPPCRGGAATFRMMFEFGFGLGGRTTEWMLFVLCVREVDWWMVCVCLCVLRLGPQKLFCYFDVPLLSEITVNVRRRRAQMVLSVSGTTWSAFFHSSSDMALWLRLFSFYAMIQTLSVRLACMKGWGWEPYIAIYAPIQPKYTSGIWIYILTGKTNLAKISNDEPWSNIGQNEACRLDVHVQLNSTSPQTLIYSFIISKSVLLSMGQANGAIFGSQSLRGKCLL